MRKQNWDEIEAREGFDSPAPGAYLARIDSVEDNEAKEYLKIEWDFAEGRYKGHNRETFLRVRFWPTPLYRSYKPSALGFFKAFKTALEASNRGFRFDEDNLSDLEGRLLGVVLGEEEYIKANGGRGRRLYVHQARSVGAIRKGSFTVPALKKLTCAPPAPEDDGRLPF